MAEFGLVASVVQIADVGVKLSITLYTFAETVLTADKSIKEIASDVSLTSSVLEELGQNLKRDEKSRLCSENAVKTAEGIVRECAAIFKEIKETLETTLDKIKPRAANGKQHGKHAAHGGRKMAVAALERLKWPFLQPKMQLLRSNLDRLKSTLVLMLNVITYARKVSEDHAAPSTLEDQRKLIEDLARSNHEYTRRFKELTKAIEHGQKQQEGVKYAPTIDKAPSAGYLQTNMVLPPSNPVQTVDETSPEVTNCLITLAMQHLPPQTGETSDELAHYCLLINHLLQRIDAVQYRIRTDLRRRIRSDIVHMHQREADQLQEVHGHKHFTTVMDSAVAWAEIVHPGDFGVSQTLRKLMSEGQREKTSSSIGLSNNVSASSAEKESPEKHLQLERSTDRSKALVQAMRSIPPISRDRSHHRPGDHYEEHGLESVLDEKRREIMHIREGAAGPARGPTGSNPRALNQSRRTGSPALGVRSMLDVGLTPDPKTAESIIIPQESQQMSIREDHHVRRREPHRGGDFYYEREARQVDEEQGRNDSCADELEYRRRREVSSHNSGSQYVRGVQYSSDDSMIHTWKETREHRKKEGKNISSGINPGQFSFKRERPSHTKSRRLRSPGLQLAEGAAAAEYVAQNKSEEKSERHSRSRIRHRSVTEASESDLSPPSQQRRHLSEAAVGGPAAIGVVERARSKSRGSRSHSRVRTGKPIVGAGLGGAAVAMLYEKAENKEIEIVCEEHYKRRKSTSNLLSDPASNRTFISYGGGPIHEDSVAGALESEGKERASRHGVSATDSTDEHKAIDSFTRDKELASSAPVKSKSNAQASVSDEEAEEQIFDLGNVSKKSDMLDDDIKLNSRRLSSFGIADGGRRNTNSILNRTKQSYFRPNPHYEGQALDVRESLPQPNLLEQERAKIQKSLNDRQTNDSNASAKLLGEKRDLQLRELRVLDAVVSVRDMILRFASSGSMRSKRKRTGSVTENAEDAILTAEAMWVYVKSLHENTYRQMTDANRVVPVAHLCKLVLESAPVTMQDWEDRAEIERKTDSTLVKTETGSGVTASTRKEALRLASRKFALLTSPQRHVLRQVWQPDPRSLKPGEAGMDLGTAWSRARGISLSLSSLSRLAKGKPKYLRPELTSLTPDPFEVPSDHRVGELPAARSYSYTSPAVEEESRELQTKLVLEQPTKALAESHEQQFKKSNNNWSHVPSKRRGLEDSRSMEQTYGRPGRQTLNEFPNTSAFSSLANEYAAPANSKALNVMDCVRAEHSHEDWGPPLRDEDYTSGLDNEEDADDISLKENYIENSNEDMIQRRTGPHTPDGVHDEDYVEYSDDDMTQRRTQPHTPDIVDDLLAEWTTLPR